MIKNLLLFLVLLSSGLRSQPIEINDTLSLINWTFLGGEQRNFYGNYAPNQLNTIWKTYLGQGKTTISRKSGERLWAGSGWTGQPLMIKIHDELFIIQGTFAHDLKYIRASDGKVLWKTDFNDVLKGTGTIWFNSNAKKKEEQLLIFQGSRLGYGNYLDSLDVESFKCVSLIDGSCLWTHNSKMTDSYSRDVDGSGLVINDTLYIGLENSLFTKMSPIDTFMQDSIARPRIYDQIKLYESIDIERHGGNLVTEGSISRLGNQIFIPSGSGRIWSYNLESDSMDWSFYVGSDIDGSAIITKDTCLLISVEKQYIAGNGGVLKLDPRKRGPESVKWFFPTPNTDFAGWEGGVIGSVSTNNYASVFPDKQLAAFSGIDSLLYLIEHNKLDTTKEWINGPREEFYYPQPKLLDTYEIGRSISTPLIVGNKLIAAGYKGIHLFEITPQLELKLIAKRNDIGEIESTPFVWNGKIYVGSRDGNLYCLGNLE